MKTGVERHRLSTIVRGITRAVDQKVGRLS